jgi:hypothetical protein
MHRALYQAQAYLRLWIRSVNLSNAPKINWKLVINYGVPVCTSVWNTGFLFIRPELHWEVVDSSAFCSRGPEIESRLADRLLWQKMFVVFLSSFSCYSRIGRKLVFGVGIKIILQTSWETISVESRDSNLAPSVWVIHALPLIFWICSNIS